MFIDDNFNDIVKALAATQTHRTKFYTNVLDGITTVLITGLYNNDDPLFLHKREPVIFPEDRMWFEENPAIDSGEPYGVLYQRLEITTSDYKNTAKTLNRHIKHINQGKNFGYFTTRKPKMINIKYLEVFRMISNNPKVGIQFIGTVFRTLTSLHYCKDIVVFTVPEPVVGKLIASLAVNVIDAQENINRLKEQRTERVHSSEIAKLHTPNEESNTPDYKLITIKPKPSEVVIKEPNPEGGHRELKYRHYREGTWRRLPNPEWVGHDKQGRKIVLGRTWVKDAVVREDLPEKEIHKDYKII
jgi:hypothetical protein